MTTNRLKQQLQQAELRLSKVERMVKLVTILSTVVTVLTGIGSGLLSYRQYEESTEKRRVSFSYSLTPVFLPSSNRFYLKAKFKNLSSRELTLLGVTARVWRGDKWTDMSSVASQPTDLVVSDNLIRDCPPTLCAANFKDGVLRRRELDDITLEVTEGDSELALGPYPISTNQLAEGVWVTGQAYVVETDRGKCTIYDKEPPPAGTFPYLCEEKDKNAADCYKNARCSDVESAAAFYSFQPKEKTLQPQ